MLESAAPRRRRPSCHAPCRSSSPDPDAPTARFRSRHGVCEPVPPLLWSRDAAKLILGGWRRVCAKTIDEESPANHTSRTRLRSLALPLGQIREPASLMRATRQSPLAYRRRLSLRRGMIRVIRERLLMRAPSPKNPFALRRSIARAALRPVAPTRRRQRTPNTSSQHRTPRFSAKPRASRSRPEKSVGPAFASQKLSTN